MPSFLQNTNTINASPPRYIGRELSWLKFNERVLLETENTDNPLLEKIRFFVISQSNLDEFFMVRVPTVKQKIFVNGADENAAETMSQIHAAVHGYYQRATQIIENEFHNPLQKIGINIVHPKTLKKHEIKSLGRFFSREVFPILTPLAIDEERLFPHLANLGFYLAILLQRKKKKSSEKFLALLQIPPSLPKIIRVPESSKADVYVHADKFLKFFLPKLFKGFKISDSYTFRLTRDADLSLEEEDSESILNSVQGELSQRGKGKVVRLELDSHIPDFLHLLLKNALDVEDIDIYCVPSLFAFYAHKDLLHNKTLQTKAFTPFFPKRVFSYENADSFFAAIRRGDILLHHPFDTFTHVEDFIAYAASDTAVIGIKMTLYRTGDNSRIVESLIRAAQNGKAVTALVELRARFDEATNIEWAKQMEKSGVHVVYGLVDFKTHCKMTLVVRKEGTKVMRYVHLSTGNYNAATAHIYTDIGILTANKSFARDVVHLFNSLTGFSKLGTLRKISAAPGNLKKQVIEIIRREKENALSGNKAHITAKMNSLVDSDVVDELYAASCSGVKIELIIRGICVLRPQVKGLSENITVRSIVGRFLEHSRILIAHNKGENEVYLTSADWMPRNFLRRIEIMFPVENKILKEKIVHNIIPLYMDDNTNAYFLQSDGTYVKVEKKIPRINAQESLLKEEGITQ
ncbi:MAG: Polyphosphate kinase [Turneriella sp.]|nr:Polyphosphate kinase [Turneriella sp.]